MYAVWKYLYIKMCMHMYIYTLCQNKWKPHEIETALRKVFHFRVEYWYLLELLWLEPTDFRASDWHVMIDDSESRRVCALMQAKEDSLFLSWEARTRLVCGCLSDALTWMSNVLCLLGYTQFPCRKKKLYLLVWHVCTGQNTKRVCLSEKGLLLLSRVCAYSRR